MLFIIFIISNTNLLLFINSNSQLSYPQLESLLRSSVSKDLSFFKNSIESFAKMLDSSRIEIWRREKISQEIQSIRERVKKAEQSRERSKIKAVRETTQCICTKNLLTWDETFYLNSDLFKDTGLYW